jgi:anti-sigma regulatory factor (Ser/Thr protein kinase)
MKVTDEDVQDVEFVIGELCSNVTRHSHSVDGRFGVSVDYFPDKVVVEVKDNGGGFSFRDVKPVGSIRTDSIGTERYGGFGLFLVEKMSDQLAFTKTEPSGTTVRAEKQLHYETVKDRCDADAMNTMHGGGLLKIIS